MSAVALGAEYFLGSGGASSEDRINFELKPSSSRSLSRFNDIMTFLLLIFTSKPLNE